MNGIIVGTMVFGYPYLDMFLNQHVPMLLAPGNLPALRHRIRYLVYTRPHEQEVIDRHPAMARLRELAEVQYIEIHPTPDNLHRMLGHAQHHLIARGWESDAGVIYLFPDMWIADGAFATIERHIGDGKRAVLSQGFSVEWQGALRDLERHFRWEGKALSVSPRELIRAGVRNLHPKALCGTWTRNNMPAPPPMMYWELGGHGLLMRAFHLSALFIHPDKPAHAFRKSFDGDLMDHAISRFDDMAIITDSDDLAWIEVNNPNDALLCYGVPNEKAVAEWAWSHYNTTEFNRRFVHYPVWHHDGVNKDAWRHIERESANVVTRIESFYPADRRQNPPPPQQVATRGENSIVEWQGTYYGVPWSLGRLEIDKINTEDYQDIIVGHSMIEVIKIIDSDGLNFS